MHTRTEQLRAIMHTHNLTADRVAEIIDRTPATVRVWRCQTEGSRVIPAHALAVLRAKVETKKDPN